MFEKLLEKLALELERKRVPYMVIGGQAVLAYGEPRLTRDIDLTLGWDTDREDLIIHKLVAGRPRDLEDVKNVLLKNPSIDESYVIRWLSEFEKTLEKPLITKFKEFKQA